MTERFHASASTPCPTRVAVADDEPNICDIVASILSHEGYEVRTASDGQELLELVASFDPDVILTDLSMPRMTGLDVVRALRARGSHARVILMTAWPVKIGESLDESVVLHKPFGLQALVEAVKR